MSQFGQSAQLMMQNKQAELGRAEDRRRDAQSMMATLLTLFMQGKISREEMDARIQMARENNASAERINAATLQTNKDIAGQQAQLAGRGLDQRKAEFDADYKFKQQMVQQLMADRWSTGLQAFLKEMPNQGLGDAQAAIAMFNDKIAKAEAAKAMFVEASDARGNYYETAKRGEQRSAQTSTELAQITQLGAVAGQQGANVAKTVVDQGLDISTPQGMTAALTSSGLLQSKAGPDILKAADLLRKQSTGEATPDDVATLRRLFVGDGKSPGIGPKAMTTLSEMFHSAGTSLLEETRSLMDQAASGQIEPEVADARANQLQVQGSKFLSYANTLRSIEPVNANLVTYYAAKNQWYQKLMQAPPGKLFNSEVFWEAYSAALGPGVSPEERVEIAKGIAAAEEASYGVGRPVEDWLAKISRGVEATAQVPPAAEANAEVSGIDQYRIGQAELIDHVQKVYALANYDRITQFAQASAPVWAQMPPEMQRLAVQSVESRLRAAESDLTRLGVAPGQVLSRVNPARVLLEADANAKSAKEKALAASRLQAAKQALGTPQPIAAPVPGVEGLPASVLQPARAPAPTARPPISSGVQQLQQQINQQAHPLPTPEGQSVGGYALPGVEDPAMTLGEAINNSTYPFRGMGAMK